MMWVIVKKNKRKRARFTATLTLQLRLVWLTMFLRDFYGQKTRRRPFQVAQWLHYISTGTRSHMLSLAIRRTPDITSMELSRTHFAQACPILPSGWSNVGISKSLIARPSTPVQCARFSEVFLCLHRRRSFLLPLEEEVGSRKSGCCGFSQVF